MEAKRDEVQDVKVRANEFNAKLLKLKRQKEVEEVELRVYERSLAELLDEYKRLTGEQLNPEDAEKVLADKLKKINMDLKSGNEILQRVENELQGIEDAESETKAYEDKSADEEEFVSEGMEEYGINAENEDDDDDEQEVEKAFDVTGFDEADVGIEGDEEFELCDDI